MAAAGPFIAGFVFLAMGALAVLTWLGIVVGEEPPPQPWVFGIAGAGLILIGAIVLLAATWDAVAGPSVRRQFAFDFTLALVALTLIAATATYAAAAAWMPELGGAFEGGITGTNLEYRIVFTTAAVVVDLFAAVLWLVALGRLLAWLGGKRR